ncbi:MAG: prohibitin family protein [Methylococcales bacterium]|nr:prohibitin family protein [Methylococcales bacterium]MDD5753217.1 prohibitin family protein [Methylococcales bacterium]
MKNTKIEQRKYRIWEKIRFWIKNSTPTLITVGILLTLTLVFFFDNIVITINSGEAGVLYRRFSQGTDTDYIYPEQVHFILPWNKMYIYQVRTQAVNHELIVLTNLGLPITLKLSIRFHPDYEMLGVLHQKVGPDYVDRIIMPQIESVLRKNIGTLEAEDVYTNREGVLNKIMWLAVEETSRNYIVVEDIIIRSIELPDVIKSAIEKKLVEQQKLATYDFMLEVEKKESERKAIEAAGIENYQAIISKTLTDKLIKWQGVHATLDLAKSENAKVVVIGSGKDGMPVILGNQ